MRANHGLGFAPRSPGPIGRFIERIRGRPLEYGLGRYRRELGQIEIIGRELATVSEARLEERLGVLRAAARQRESGVDLAAAGQGEAGIDLAPLRPEAFALARESAARVLGTRPFDVQMIGALALHQGRSIEMQTGEGKTLVAVMPAFLDALSGRGVQVLTFNDYLARRDADWMGPLYRFLGVRVACVQSASTPAQRREAYRADVTYLTAKEAGFDYLRDGLAYEAGERVQRPFFSAVVDEADSLLIDEARIPLVIAGRTEEAGVDAARLAALARRLKPGVDYEADRQRQTVSMTDAGLSRVETELRGIDLHAAGNAELLTAINVALHAEGLVQRDVDYIVRDGRIELVDEFTGRVVQDRHWPDGLQAAVEAKEHLRRGEGGAILGSVTLQHFFGLYPKLAAMTATARPEEEELAERYGLKVVLIPPHRPDIRRDLPDRVFRNCEAKLEALIREISATHASGRPVLVGTGSVRESEELGGRLREVGIPCAILNAKTDEREAKVIADAGAVGAVTISTNMAGRGTDIRLGGADERQADRVRQLGGLYVIGTNRHESRRIDRQLRGRAGRQGDPGSSRFFISLEDDLIARHRITDILPERARDAVGEEELHDPVVGQRIAWAQRVVEGRNLDVRRGLWQFSAFVDAHRSELRRRRDQTLVGGDGLCGEQAPDTRAALCARLGPQGAADVERRVVRDWIDRLWAEHLAFIADLREGIQLVRLAGRSPVDEFRRQAAGTFRELRERLEDEILTTLERLAAGDGDVDLDAAGIRAPAATWTYLIDDNPFERSSSSLLTGHSISLSVGAAALGPLYALGAAYNRWRKKRE